MIAPKANSIPPQPPQPRSQPLSTLSTGEIAKIVQVSATADDALRLKALGVCVGRWLQVVKTGDPLIISVVGARVGLSVRLAAEVVVELAVQSPLQPAFAPLANAS